MSNASDLGLPACSLTAPPTLSTLPLHKKKSKMGIHAKKLLEHAIATNVIIQH